jgi:8-oxo-dGTP diphosphatase
MILLIRHASAGERAEWEGDDRLRPLDERGVRQAWALVEGLAGYELGRILSSPYLRCVQTVEPLATARGLTVEARDELGEERQWSEAGPLLLTLGDEPVAVCTHGGVPELLGCEARYKKGETLVLGPQRELLRSIPAAG